LRSARFDTFATQTSASSFVRGNQNWSEEQQRFAFEKNAPMSAQNLTQISCLSLLSD
jgi:hypothetical protein